MMLKYFFTVALALVGVHTHAQSARDSVKVVINKMFEAMHNADSAGVAKCFHDSARMQTFGYNKERQVTMVSEGFKDFASTVSKLGKGDADERISFEAIKIDGPLAAVWTPYEFYYKGKFSHCGVNSFQLVRSDGNWKIIYIIDTRRKVGCKPGAINPKK